MEKEKSRLAVLQSHSLRELVDMVNHANQSAGGRILKKDIVGLYHEDETYFLLYYSD